MTEEVKDRIEEALKNQAKILNLSHCDLEELPKGLEGLAQLEFLMLDGNIKLSDLRVCLNFI